MLLGVATCVSISKRSFRLGLLVQLREANDLGEVHRTLVRIETYQMPVCCQVMYREQRAGDHVVAAPPKGQGATLSIEYQLPR